MRGLHKFAVRERWAQNDVTAALPARKKPLRLPKALPVADTIKQVDARGVVVATPDRAGLLAGQDIDAARRALMKLAGGSRMAELSHDAFHQQAHEYDAVPDLRDSVLKLLQRVMPADKIEESSC